MAAARAWATLVPGVSSRIAAELANAWPPCLAGKLFTVPLTGNECFPSIGEAFQRRLKLATAVHCSTADRPVDVEHEVGKKRGRGRPRKVGVAQENDGSQRLESSQELPTSNVEDAKESGRKEVAKLESPGVQNGNATTHEVNNAYPGTEHAGGPPTVDKTAGGGKVKQRDSKQPAETYDKSNGVKDPELHARIEEELARVRAVYGDEADDYPLSMEEDDPSWPEEADEGYGFKLSEFFDDKKVKVMNDNSNKDDNNDGFDDDELTLHFKEEYGTGKIEDITQDDWTTTVFANLSPVLVFVYERYGPRGQAGWDMLKEVEKTVQNIYQRVPVRAVKIDAGLEVDLAAAIKVQKTPVVLFVKSGKILHAVEGFTSADDLGQIAAHFFYGAKRPKCLDKVASSVKKLEVS